MNDIIFDDYPRSDHEYATQSEPVFEFIDKCSRTEVQNIRNLINNWFHNYPNIQKCELSHRLKNNDDISFHSAFFELFSFYFLNQIGNASPNEQGNKIGKMYDFLLKIGSEEICVESTVVYESEPSRRQEVTRSKIIDYININAKVSGFSYDFQIENTGENYPELNKIARKIKKWALENNQDDLRNRLEANSDYELPELIINSNSWIFKIRLIPKKIGIDDSNHDAIGIGPMVSGWRNDSESIKNSIMKKAKCYTSIGNRPYYILCNCMLEFGVDHIDVLDALFGKEVYRFNPRTGKGYNDRLWDGVWRGPKGPRNTTLNGIILFDKMYPWNIRDQQPVLYLNPWPKCYDSLDWWRWKKYYANFENDTYEKKDGSAFDNSYIEKWY